MHTNLICAECAAQLFFSLSAVGDSQQGEVYEIGERHKNGEGKKF